MPYNCFIGIDPGKDGGIAIQNSDGEIWIEKTPQVANEIDIQGLIEIFENTAIYNSQIKPICVIEDVHAIFGSSAKATFSFGKSAGILEGVLSAMKIPFVKVAPKKWQAVLFEGIREIRKPNKKNGLKGNLDTKPMALLAVKRLYPKLKLTATAKSQKPHEGIVDAICLLHYSKIKYGV